MKYVVDGENLREILWLLFRHKERIWKSSEGFHSYVLLEFFTTSLRGIWLTLIILGFVLNHLYLLLIGMFILFFQILLNAKIKQNREATLQEPPEYDENLSS
jgi:hypothetical protein